MQITVKELKEKLSKFPENHKVVFWKNDTEEKEQTLVAIADKYFPDGNDGEPYQSDEVYLELVSF